MQKNNQEWLEILQQKVYRKKKDNVIPRLVVIEKGKSIKKSINILWLKHQNIYRREILRDS